MTAPGAPAAQGFPGGFAVLMPVCGKDDPQRFAKALASIFNNDLLPDQMVLIADGPLPDALDREAAALNDNPAIQVVRLDRQVGIADALNAGLAQVQTDWIARADADDINLPHRFHRLAELARSDPRLDLVGSAVLEVDRSGRPAAVRDVPLRHEDILRTVSRRNPFNHMTVACRSALVRQCGGYPDIFGREDYALWASMIAAGARCANLPDVLVHACAGHALYRRRGGLRNAVAERKLQALLVELGLKSRAQALLHGLARSGVFLAPAVVRRLIYKTLLRRTPGTQA